MYPRRHRTNVTNVMMNRTSLFDTLVPIALHLHIVSYTSTSLLDFCPSRCCYITKQQLELEVEYVLPNLVLLSFPSFTYVTPVLPKMNQVPLSLSLERESANHSFSTWSGRSPIPFTRLNRTRMTLSWTPRPSFSIRESRECPLCSFNSHL